LVSKHIGFYTGRAGRTVQNVINAHTKSANAIYKAHQLKTRLLLACEYIVLGN